MARKDEAYLYLKNAIISNQLMPDLPICYTGEKVEEYCGEFALSAVKK